MSQYAVGKIFNLKKIKDQIGYRWVSCKMKQILKIINSSPSCNDAAKPTKTVRYRSLIAAQPFSFTAYFCFLSAHPTPFSHQRLIRHTPSFVGFAPHLASISRKNIAPPLINKVAVDVSSKKCDALSALCSPRCVPSFRVPADWSATNQGRTSVKARWNVVC
jgi:hypothetical protein